MKKEIVTLSQYDKDGGVWNRLGLLATLELLKLSFTTPMGSPSCLGFTLFNPVLFNEAIDLSEGFGFGELNCSKFPDSTEEVCKDIVSEPKSQETQLILNI